VNPSPAGDDVTMIESKVFAKKPDNFEPVFFSSLSK
jgi:hypothetical protein